MTIDWRGKINIGNADLRKVVRAAYDLSGARGLGHLHFREGSLSDEEVDRIVNRERGDWMQIAAAMDYVNGRSVKMDVRRDPETLDLYVEHRWFDHGRGDLEEFLALFGVAPDAIDKAEEEAAEAHREWEAEQAAKAKASAAWLRENGGRASNTYEARLLISEEIREGLHAAVDAKLCTYDYDTMEFVLVDPAPDVA